MYKKVFRCLYRRCPPLPIPNREVKPARADGIAVTGGRVGRCLILYESPLSTDSGLSVFGDIGKAVREQAGPVHGGGRMRSAPTEWGTFRRNGDPGPSSHQVDPGPFPDLGHPPIPSILVQPHHPSSTPRIPNNIKSQLVKIVLVHLKYYSHFYYSIILTKCEL